MAKIPVSGFHAYRNVNALSHALSYDAEILKQFQTTLQFSRIRLLYSGLDFNIDFPYSQPALLVSRVLDSYFRTQSLQVQT